MGAESDVVNVMDQFEEDVRRARILEAAREAIERCERREREHEAYLRDSADIRRAAQEWTDETLRRRQEEQRRIDAANERATEQERLALARARSELERMEEQRAKRLPKLLQYEDSGRHPKIFYRVIVV